jgi:predicted amidophosphoribosyltransferase
VTFIGMIWFVGFVVLALVWLMSRPSRRLCPRCGNEAKKGLTVCPSCKYEFGVAPTA